MTSTTPAPGDATPTRGKLEETIRKYVSGLPDINQPLGHNRILKLIAEGGSATVYKVLHEELEIVRAVKILKPGFNEESKERIRTEAKISAHLHHPNIVEMYGVHFWNDTVPYLEMEYVDGMSLRQFIDRDKRLPFQVAVSIIRFVCNALHYAHNQTYTLYGKSYEGIVHRDIKPANILLTRQGFPKLADFGIAKPVEISLHTVGQKVMGTFTYLSPEQLNGEPLDRRSDIYSLGTVLYECITGEKAFPQKTLADLIREKLKNQYRRIDSFGIDIPKKIEQIIDKSMQIKRENRYADAEEFGNELYGVLKNWTDEPPEKILSRHLSARVSAETPEPGKKRGRRLPFILFGSFFLVFAVILAVFFAEALKMKRVQPPMTAAKDRPLARPRADSVAPVVSATQPAMPPPPNATARRDPVKERPEAALPLPQVSAPASQPASLHAPKPDALSAGIAAYRARRFREALPLLESGLRKEQDDSLHRYATVCLLESYLSVNNLAAARRIVESERIVDGYFFLLAGKTYQGLGELSPAIDALNKAWTVPSKYKKDLRRKDAMFLWAKATEEAYAAKPNSENKRLALRAWRQFSEEFCGEPEVPAGHCRDAGERLRNLTD